MYLSFEEFSAKRIKSALVESTKWFSTEETLEEKWYLALKYYGQAWWIMAEKQAAFSLFEWFIL